MTDPETIAAPEWNIPEVEDTGEYESESVIFGPDQLAALQGDTPEAAPAPEPAPEAVAEPEPAPAAEPEPAAEAAEPTLTAEQLQALRQDAERWQQFAELYARSPASVFTEHFKALSPADQAYVTAHLCIAAPHQPQQADEAPVIEGLTPQEAIVETYRQHIAQLPALSQQMEQMASLPQQLAQELAGRDQHLVDAHYQISVLQAQVAALMELNSLALPEVDRGAIDAALRAGKTIPDAVREQYSTKARQAAITAKQERAPKPSTPRASSGNAAMNLPTGASAAEIWAALDAVVTR